MPARTTGGAAPGAAGRTPPVGRPLQVATGLLLTAVAGFVDAIGIIALGGLFASFMSGASVSLGIGAGGGQWGVAYQGALMIVVFLGGVALGTVVAGVAGAWGLPVALALDAVLLTGAVLLADRGWAAATVILPVVAAMGIQNTALRPLEGVRLGATFITGTLVSLGQSLGNAVLGRPVPAGWPLQALLWGALTAGAGAGAALHHALGYTALGVPAVLVAALALVNMAAAIGGARAWNAGERGRPPPEGRGAGRPAYPPSARPFAWPYY
ncbi:MAG: DUF1275 family protein [Geminicoccaceae bacterium]|nr:DUF1275 family protein [Geminicoccaceae bacterium]